MASEYFECNGKECITGVCCDVCSCTHNDKCGHCIAKQIQIGPNDAHRADDTVCDTFSAE